MAKKNTPTVAPVQTEAAPVAVAEPTGPVESPLMKTIREGREALLAEREKKANSIKADAAAIEALDEQYRQMFVNDPPMLDLPVLSVTPKRRGAKLGRPLGSKNSTGARGGTDSGPGVVLSFLLEHGGKADTKAVQDEVQRVTNAQFPNAATAYLKREGLITQDSARGGNYVLTPAGRLEAKQRSAK